MISAISRLNLRICIEFAMLDTGSSLAIEGFGWGMCSGGRHVKFILFQTAQSPGKLYGAISSASLFQNQQCTKQAWEPGFDT